MLDGGKGCPAEGAAEVSAVEPAVEAGLVELVAAGEPAHLVPVLEVAEADDAAVLIRGQSGGETAGECAVEVELVGESDEAGEAGAEGGEDGVFEVEGLRGWAEAERLEDGREGRADMAEVGGEEGEEQEWDGIRRDVAQLALQTHDFESPQY